MTSRRKTRPVSHAAPIAAAPKTAHMAAVFAQRVIDVSLNAAMYEQVIIARIGIDEGDTLSVRVHDPVRQKPLVDFTMDATDITGVDGVLSQLTWIAAQITTIREARHALASNRPQEAAP